MRRIALIGSRAGFTHGVLTGLLERHVTPVALMLHGEPGGGGMLPVETPHAVDRLAYARDIPVSTVRDGAQALRNSRQAGADVVLVACFPRRLPVEGGHFPAGFVFNLHPAPLPAYRGPTPLFWQFRAGVTSTAVSLQRVAPRFDSGAVLAREWLALPAGAVFSAVNRRLSGIGAELAVRHLVRAAHIGEGVAQTEQAASYLGFPDESAFEVSTTWPAERLYRFMVGTREWRHDYVLRCEAGVFHLARALDYHQGDARQTRLVEEQGEGRFGIRCTPGVVAVEGRRVG